MTDYRAATRGLKKSKGGGDFYDRDYSSRAASERSRKSMPHKVVGTLGKVKIRSDASCPCPSRKLALVVNSNAEIVGYTMGQTNGSRDIRA